MRDVFNVAARHLVPSIRRSLAIELVKRGVPEARAAQVLGLSRSTITRYVRSERGASIDLSRFGDVIRMISECAEAIIAGRIAGQRIDEAVARIAAYILMKKYLCTYHAEIDPRINTSRCDICPTIFADQASISEILKKCTLE